MCGRRPTTTTTTTSVSHIFLILSRAMLSANNKKKSTKSGKGGSSAAAPPQLRPIKFDAGPNLMKELQRTLFFAAYEDIYFCGKPLKGPKQKAAVYQKCFGDGKPDTVSYAKQFVHSINQFSSLYDDVDIQINDDPNATTDEIRTTTRKQLKDRFSPKSIRKVPN